MSAAICRSHISSVRPERVRQHQRGSIRRPRRRRDERRPPGSRCARSLPPTVEHAIDERVGAPQIAGRVQETRDLGRPAGAPPPPDGRGAPRRTTVSRPPPPRRRRSPARPRAPGRRRRRARRGRARRAGGHPSGRGSPASARRRPRDARGSRGSMPPPSPPSPGARRRASTRRARHPPPRSCSCTIEASSVETSAGARSAHAIAATAATGLRLCGSVDEPPRPAPPRAPRATSVCAMSVTSRATLPMAPAATPSAPASSPMRVRSVCHAIVGSASPSSTANARSTDGPSSPSEASVPTAPPS